MERGIRTYQGESFESWVTRNEAVCIILGLFDETRLLASFGGSITQNRAVGILWGVSYAKRGCLLHLGARFCEMELLASFGSSITETEGLVSFRGWVTRNFGCPSAHMLE